MRISAPLAAFFAACLFVSGSGRAAVDRIVVAIENQSGSPAARDEVAALLKTSLTNKGWEVVAGPEVDATVAQAGAAHVEALSGAGAAQLQDRFQAKRAIAVTVRFLLPSASRARGPKASAAIGFTARAWTGSRVTWRNSLGLIDDAIPDQTQPRRKPKSLAAMATSRLLWSFPNGNGTIVADALEFEDGSDNVRVVEFKVPEYDVLIERLRAARTGPRFRLRMDRKR